MRILPGLLTFCGVGAVLGMAGCHAPAKSDAPPPAVAVELVQVTSQSISDLVTGGGVLFPLHQASLAPKVSSPVRRFYVNRGDTVRPGQLLAVLEGGDLAGAAVAAKGTYDQAKATYTKTVSATLPEQVQAAKLALENAKAAREGQQKVYDSLLWLYEQHAGARAPVDQAAVALTTAKNQEQTAEKQLADLEAVGRSEDLLAAKGQLEMARGQLLTANAQLGYTELRSPIAGLVADRSVYQGDIASAGTPLLTVVDVSRVIVRLHLSLEQRSKLKLGDKATLTVPGLSRAVNGSVSVISPALDPNSTTTEVWVEAPNPGHDLQPGTSVQVALVARVIPAAIVVPRSALLVDDNGINSVMVVDSKQKAQRQTVTPGVQQGNLVQIVQGLQPGETIVATGAYGLPDGTPVKAAPAGSSTAATGSSTGSQQ